MAIDIDRVLVELETLATEIRQRTPTAVRMLRDYRRGYRTGHDAPTTGDTYQSSTEALALRGADHIDRDIDTLERALLAGLRQLQTAHNVASRYQAAACPTAGSTASSTAGADMWCTNCATVGHMEPRAVGRFASLCQWCGTFKAVQGFLPPARLLEAHHRGERISQTLIDRALAPARAEQRRKAQQRRARAR